MQYCILLNVYYNRISYSLQGNTHEQFVVPGFKVNRGLKGNNKDVNKYMSD